MAQPSAAPSEPWTLPGLPDGSFDVLRAVDADNDGRRDLVAAGPEGIAILGRTEDGFQALEVDAAPAVVNAAVSAVVSADLDADGDLDLVTAGPAACTGWRTSAPTAPPTTTSP